MNMKYWSRMAATTSATATTAAAAPKSKAAPTAEEQFTALVELTAAQLTSARLMLAEEAKKMRAAASAPSMLTAGNTNGRCRSLSSTWETTDSDDVGDDASDVEEYDGDDPMGMSSDAHAQSAAAAEAAARRNLFTSTCDYDDDTEHEESKDAFYDLAHARDVASLARASSSNTLPILRRMSASSGSSSSAASSGVDVTTATYPSVLPAMRVSGRRRSNSQNARNRRRRTRSESAASGVSNGSSSSQRSSSSGSGSSLHRERRLRIISPIGSKIFFSGWVRGQPAEVLWEVFDKSVEAVRIELCNVGWDVPTPVAQQVANDGRHVWRRVVWGLPIEEGYYVNIYDATHPEQLDADGKLPLLAQSERFAVTG